MIVFLHGVGGGAALFDDVKARVGGRAIDLPVLPSVDEIADALASELDDAILVGHSLGGAVAQVIARRHAQRVRGLVLVSTSLRFPAAAQMREMLAADEATFRESFKDALGPKHAVPVSRALFDAHAAHALDAWFAACASHDGRGKTLAAPAVVIHGGADRVVPPKAAKSLAEALNAPLVEVAGKEHMLPEEAPEEVAAAISRLTRG